MIDWNKKKIISIDFDGVIAKYDGYKGEDIVGVPIKGALEFIEKLKKHGYTPVIHTVRSADIVKNWLKENQFPAIEVTNTKYPSILYIDDRCIQFDGDYDTLNHKMKEFDVYWRKKDKKIFGDWDI